MSGLDSLVRGTVGSFAKDKVSSYLSPTQMDFARFAMNPQMYLAEKGISAVAELLGYGGEYRTLKRGAQDENEDYKQVMRDSIGNMLPDAVGDFVRATPRRSEADSQPAGAYTVFDPETQTYIQQGSFNPVASSNSAGFDNFVRDLNYGTHTPGTGKAVGPLPEGNPIFENNVSNLPYELMSTPVSGAPDNFDPALLAAVIRDDNEIKRISGRADQKPSSNNLPSTEMIDILNSTSNIPDYSRAYGALGGAESVSNLRDQFLNMGLDENTIGSVFSNYYAPEVGNRRN